MLVDVLLDAPLEGVEARVRQLAACGVDGLFSFENAHDVFFPLVLAAGATELDLMTNVAIAFPRSPVHLAHSAYDLQSLSKGRFRLGLGSQVRAHVERRYGAQFAHPAARMAETTLAIKAIFACWQDGRPLDFRGEFTSHTLMPPVFNPGPNPYGSPPVFVGALGPKMTEWAATVADGILIMPFNSARHLKERTLPAIEQGLKKAGREPGDLQIECETIVAMGRSDEEIQAARSGVRNLLAFYASTPAYRPVLEVEGWQQIQPELNTMSKRGEWLEMARRIDDTMLDTLAVAGTPEQCAIEINRRFGSIATRVSCYFPGYDVSDDLLSALTAAIKQFKAPT
jgi:probable F420-dependent oxidoreductase